MCTRKNILELIPQKPPFVMIDALLQCDEMSATTTFIVNADNILVKEGELKEPGIIENIAQTAAARMGYLYLQEQKPVPVGFIGAVQNLKINALPKTGNILTTTVTIVNHVFNATIINGIIKSNNVDIANCEMKIFITS